MSGRFVNFSQYLAANEDNAKRAADAVGNSVDGYATAAQDATSALRTDVQTGKAPSGAESSLYPGAAAATQRATQAAANTGTAGGLQYELDASGVKGGTLGGERFNSGLAGTVGRERYAAQRSRYAGLQDALNGEAKRTPLVNAPVRPTKERTPVKPPPGVMPGTPGARLQFLTKEQVNAPLTPESEKMLKEGSFPGTLSPETIAAKEERERMKSRRP